jgi:DNA mismatch repair ATPase MutL
VQTHRHEWQESRRKHIATQHTHLLIHDLHDCIHALGEKASNWLQHGDDEEASQDKDQKRQENQDKKDSGKEKRDRKAAAKEDKTSELILERIASMSCKAAVKGNHVLSKPEIESLIDELLSLDNPFRCPHGRPTIIAMTQYELDKKFKRIV